MELRRKFERRAFDASNVRRVLVQRRSRSLTRCSNRRRDRALANAPPESAHAQRHQENPLATADKLRANMDAAEYKRLVLDLIFVKYISDTFQAEAWA